MCLLDLFQGLEEAAEVAYTIWGLLLGFSNAEKGLLGGSNAEK